MEKCSHCKVEGHRRTICPQLRNDYPLISETQENKRNATRNGGKQNINNNVPENEPEKENESNATTNNEENENRNTAMLSPKSI